MNEEEKSLLDDILTSDYWSVILKAMDMGLERQREAVLASNVNDADRVIILNKARLDGAIILKAFMMSLKRKKDKDATR